VDASQDRFTRLGGILGKEQARLGTGRVDVAKRQDDPE